MLPEWHLLPQAVVAAFHLLGPSRGGPAGIFLFYSVPALLHIGISTTSWGVRVECLPPSMDVSGRLHVFSSGISSSGSVQVLTENVKDQLKQFILVAPCWMEAPCLSTVLNMLEDVPWQCPVLKDLIIDVSVGLVLKGLSYLDLTLWLLNDVCYADRASLPQSVRQWQWQIEHLHQRSTSSVGRNGQVGVLDRVSKLMSHFYLQHPPSCKCFDPWHVEHCVYLCWRVGNLVLLSLLLSLL